MAEDALGRTFKSLLETIRENRAIPGPYARYIILGRGKQGKVSEKVGTQGQYLTEQALLSAK